MIFPSSEIDKHFKNLGLDGSETIMIHGDLALQHNTFLKTHLTLCLHF